MPGRFIAAVTAASVIIIPGIALASGGGGEEGTLGLVDAIGLAIVSACLLAVILNFIKVPSLLAYILSGLLLGVFASPLLGDSIQIMAHISHLGLVFLLFIIGLEMDIGSILHLGPRTALAVLLQAPIAIGAVLGIQYAASALGVSIPGLGTESPSFLYYAVACAFGSTAVVVKLLGDKFDLESKAGRITVLTLIAEDIFAVLALSYVLSKSGQGGGSMLLLLGGGAGLAVAFVLFSKYVLSRVMARFSTSPDMLSLIALGWCFLCADGISRVGLSAEMGALIAGLTIGRLRQHIEILAKVSSLRDFFMALYFVALGMTLPLPGLSVLAHSLALVFIVVAVRLALFTPTLLLGRSGPIISLTAAINLSQISEFTLLLIPIGLASGALTKHDSMVISYGLMMSIVLTGLTIKYNYPIAMALSRLVPGRGGHPEAASTTGKQDAGHGHGAEIVMLGYFLNAEALAHQLGAQDPELLKRILVIDFNLQNHEKIRKQGMKVVYGDIGNPETLRHHGILNAKVILSTISNAFLRGIRNQDLVNEISRLNPSARVIVTADNEQEADELVKLGAFRAISPSAMASPAFVRALDEALVAEVEDEDEGLAD